jgi:hypothetical protein
MKNKTISILEIVKIKLHWAITGKTAAELIANRANATQPLTHKAR